MYFNSEAFFPKSTLKEEGKTQNEKKQILWESNTNQKIIKIIDVTT